MDKYRKIIFRSCEFCGCYERVESMCMRYHPRFGRIIQMCHNCNYSFELSLNMNLSLV